MVIFNYIYMFHMPLFVFVSGRFSHIRDRKKYIERILRLFETYLVFQIIRTILQSLGGNEITYACLITPQWTLWYLVALIYWRLMVYNIPERFLLYRKMILIISLFICIIAGFIPINHSFAIQRTFFYLPFFVIGYYSSDFDILKLINKIPSFCAILLLFVIFLLFFFLFGDKNLSCVHHGTYSYWSYDFQHTMLRFTARCIYVPVAIVMGVFVMRLVPSNETLAKWGRITLFIYIYHTFAISVLIWATKRGYIPQNELLLFVYSVIITMGLLLLSHFKLLNVFLNPISYYKNVYNQGILKK